MPERPRRWKAVGLVLAGMLAGTLLIQPAGAHFIENTRHLGVHAWSQVIRDLVYTRNQANNRFYTKSQADNRFVRTDCPGVAPDDVMVKVGGICVDAYQASIWDAPVGGSQITGAIPCNANGQDCTNIYARSVAGVEPRHSITWFQAQQALANSGKRLLSNAEWQMAVAGTPNPTSVNLAPCQTGSLRNTGAAPGCVSNHGTFDMVGNLYEWVGDWVPRSTGCPGWFTFSDDIMCLSGADTGAGGPGALLRGGGSANGSGAGPFAVNGLSQPSVSSSSFGFRGAR